MKTLALLVLACSACVQTTGPVEPVVLPPVPPPGPLQVMRDALDGCARSYGLAGELRVRVQLNELGKVIAVSSEYGDHFASCVGNATLRLRDRSHASRTLLVTFIANGA